MLKGDAPIENMLIINKIGLLLQPQIPQKIRKISQTRSIHHHSLALLIRNEVPQGIS